MPTKCVCDKDGVVLSVKNNINLSTPINLVTIKDAMIQHSQRENYNNDIIINKNINSSVDILCIILSVHHTKIPRNRNYTSFLITDKSLPNHTCAKIHLYSSSIGSCSSTDNVHANPGDAFRFNSMIIKQNYGIGITNSNASHRSDLSISESQSSLPSIVCEFVSSWKHPEAGAIYVKFDNYDTNNTNGKQTLLSSPLPPNMMSTPMKQVHNLQKWFRGSHYVSNNLLQSSALAISKCRRRKLRDITTSHLLSDVLVQVLSVEYTSSTTDTTHTEISTTKKWHYHHYHGPPIASINTIAMIRDGTEENDIITCINCHRIQQDLNAAIRSKSQVLITRVLSRDNDGIGIVLEVTNLSNVITTSVDSDNLLLPFTSNIYYSNKDHDNDDSRQLFISQQKFTDTSLKIMEPIQKEIFCRITDIYIPSKNISLLNPNLLSLSTATILVQTLLLDNMQPDYYDKSGDDDVDDNLRFRNAILSLQQQQSTSSTIKVNANGKIIQTLCCGIKPKELLQEQEELSSSSSSAGETPSSINNNQQQFQLSEVLLNLLHSMVKEEIIFRWTIEHCRNEALSEEWNCVDVHLLSL